MIDQGFMTEQPAGKLSDLLRHKPLLQPIISVTPEEPVSRAAQLLRQFNISQLPVLQDEVVVGSIQEAEVMRLVLEKVDLTTTTVRDVMGHPFPQLDVETSVADACYTVADGDAAVLVTSNRRPVGVLTKIDFIHYMADVFKK
ncbi:putative cystathionine beta-synthase [compost metagenome]